MEKPYLSQTDEIVEQGDEQLLVAILALSRLSVQDAERVARLQKYSEILYLYGFDIPRIRITGVS